MNSLYIHIPFCRKKCDYCDFYSKPYHAALAADFVDALCRQIRLLDATFCSVYIGGGTPTVLSMVLLRKLLIALKKKNSGGGEYTIEANPESFDHRRLMLFRDSGVNRISIGAQSFRDAKLRKLGRIHSARVALNVVYSCARRGFSNIGIDLIYGVGEETFAQWREELHQAVSLPVQHISLYALSYEKGTPLYKKRAKKTVVPVDDELSARMYEYACVFLARHGFIRYEVSNFARAGFYSRHNMHYWRNESYVGLGPSAASFVNGERQKNIADIQKYITRVRQGVSAVISREKLGSRAFAKETAAVKIRTAEGISFEWFKCRTGFEFLDLEKKELGALLRDNLLVRGRSDVRLTDRGFLFCDTVSSALL